MNDSRLNAHEELFISSFVLEDRQARIQTLLANRKGRQKMRRKFAHYFYFKKMFIHNIPAKQQTTDGIMKLLLDRGAPRECYVISEIPTLDGMLLPLIDAITRVVGSGMGTIVSCIPGQLAYYEGEDMGNRIILSRS